MAAARRIVPLLDRVLVERVKAQQKTASGILIPEKALETLQEGVVKAVGPGAPNKEGTIVPVALKVGDRVILPSYGGNGIKSTSKNDDSELLLFREADILAKVE